MSTPALFTLAFERELLPDVARGLLLQADALDGQVRKVEADRARQTLEERAEKDAVNAVWIRQLRERAAGLRSLAQQTIRAEKLPL